MSVTIQKIICSFVLFCFLFFSFAQEENKLEVPEEKIEFKETSQNPEIKNSQNQESVESQVQQPGEQKQSVESQVQQPGEQNQNVESQVQQPGEQNQNVESQVQQPGEQNQISQESANEGESELPSEELSQEVPLSSDDSDLQLKIKERISVYEYDPLLREDPFAKPGDIDIPEIIGEKIHPLEEGEVENLKLKAIIWSDNGVIPRALFETGNGQTYTVSKNDRIGSQGSVIYRIDRNVVWYMKPTRSPGTEQIRYQPESLSLGMDPAEDQNEGGLWYEK